MGSYSINIDLGIPTDTRENLIQYYEFINTWTDLLGLDNKKIKAKFQYDIGDITCTSDTLEEFKAESVGQQTDLVNMTLHIYDGDKSLYYISISKRYKSSPKNVYISSKSRQVLSKLLDCIEQAKEKYSSHGSEQQIIEQHIHGDQISITGSQISGSNIGGRQNTINAQDDKKEKTTLKAIVETIVANITSNAIWWGIGVAVAAVLAYLGVNNL